MQHNLTIEGEKKLILATGGNTPWGVWVASQHNLDIRLYHATKYTILAEINIRQCLTQKFMCRRQVQLLVIIIHNLSSYCIIFIRR